MGCRFQEGVNLRNNGIKTPIIVANPEQKAIRPLSITTLNPLYITSDLSIYIEQSN